MFTMDAEKAKARKRRKPRISLAPGVYHHKNFDAPDSSDDDNSGDENNAPYVNSMMPPAPDNITSLTVQKLKSLLTEMDVTIPASAKRKQHYIDLVYEHHPDLKDQKPPVVATRRKRGGRR